VDDHGLQTAQMLIADPLRDGDTFGTEVSVGADATPIERLVAFTGRSI